MPATHTLYCCAIDDKFSLARLSTVVGSLHDNRVIFLTKTSGCKKARHLFNAGIGDAFSIQKELSPVLRDDQRQLIPTPLFDGARGTSSTAECTVIRDSTLLDGREFVPICTKVSKEKTVTVLRIEEEEKAFTAIHTPGLDGDLACRQRTLEQEHRRIDACIRLLKDTIFD